MDTPEQKPIPSPFHTEIKTINRGLLDAMQKLANLSGYNDVFIGVHDVKECNWMFASKMNGGCLLEGLKEVIKMMEDEERKESL